MDQHITQHRSRCKEKSGTLTPCHTKSAIVTKTGELALPVLLHRSIACWRRVNATRISATFLCTYVGPDMSLCIGDAEGTARRNGTGRLTNIYVEGETPGDVKMVVDRLGKELGVVDLTPWLPTFCRRLATSFSE